jgi:hypothetical protein
MKSEEHSMKVIIAGSRQIEDYDALKALIEDTDWPIEEVVSGGCRGVDVMGERWAEENGIPVKVFAADWARWGREAGELRNREMAAYADGLILLWDGKSPGASCMLREASKAGIRVRHHVWGMDLHDLSAQEDAVMEHIWEGKGRLMFRHSHWEWETAGTDAPPVTQDVVAGLIEKGLLAEATLTVLEPVHERGQSRFA